MRYPSSHALRKVLAGAFIAAAGLAATGAQAAPGAGAAGATVDGTPIVSTQETRRIKTDRYKPVLGMTPDGCQVWMIDDGWEGYAWNRTHPDGRPVCLKVETCLTLNADVLFATDSARVHPARRAELAKFFRQEGVFSYAINGHTDSRASDAYNIDLSIRRAKAVAAIAQSAGARVAAIRGFGERMPVASNATAAGMQKNRRVEVVCYRDIGRY